MIACLKSSGWMFRFCHYLGLSPRQDCCHPSSQIAFSLLIDAVCQLVWCLYALSYRPSTLCRAWDVQRYRKKIISHLYTTMVTVSNDCFLGLLCIFIIHFSFTFELFVWNISLYFSDSFCFFCLSRAYSFFRNTWQWQIKLLCLPLCCTEWFHQRAAAQGHGDSLL